MRSFIRGSILVASLSFNFFAGKELYFPVKKYVTLKQENAETIQDNLRKEESKIATAKNVKEENHQQKQN